MQWIFFKNDFKICLYIFLFLNKTTFWFSFCENRFYIIFSICFYVRISTIYCSPTLPLGIIICSNLKLTLPEEAFSKCSASLAKYFCEKDNQKLFKCLRYFPLNGLSLWYWKTLKNGRCLCNSNNQKKCINTFIGKKCVFQSISLSCIWFINYFYAHKNI